MNIFSLLLVCALVCLQFTSTTKASQQPKYIQPGNLYAGPEINIKSPNNKGWYITSTSGGGIEFARVNYKENVSYGAQVLSFPFPETKSPEAFVNFIKTVVESNTDNKRFVIIDSKYEHSNERPYPCVRSSAKVKDTQSKVSYSKTTVQILQKSGLYCRHPFHRTGGIAIVFSRRGPVAVSNFDRKANEFINGVQVPNKSKK